MNIIHLPLVNETFENQGRFSVREYIFHKHFWCILHEFVCLLFYFHFEVVFTRKFILSSMDAMFDDIWWLISPRSFAQLLTAAKVTFDIVLMNTVICHFSLCPLLWQRNQLLKYIIHAALTAKHDDNGWPERFYISFSPNTDYEGRLCRWFGYTMAIHKRHRKVSALLKRQLIISSICVWQVVTNVLQVPMVIYQW